MNTEQRKLARLMAWVLVAVGPLSAIALLASQSGDVDTVQMMLAASMMLPSLFGLAVLALLRRLPPEEPGLSP